MTKLQFNDWMTNAWLMPDECLTTAWRLPDDCLTTTWRLPDDCLTTAWRLPDDCLTTADDSLTTDWQMIDDYATTARFYNGNLTNCQDDVKTFWQKIAFFRAYLVTILKALGIVILHHILYHNGVEVWLKSHLNSYWQKQCGPSMAIWSRYKICFQMCMNTYCVIIW
jgi:hypothetical protein